ncbi:hypothetical protein EDD37DRAFT_401254 [Exophiala viscosa]|uniref:Cytochrome c oxidase assembly protein COX20, mitochondrial n=1 Tax=Exophiala viscosa TaxID=2486360 RepID=A0AAN6E1L6_9EURO|nr:hypothetical protein EDD36DRAFT_169708 [Exophiala viscosa]KAI1624143.1 hypothetical protein EDD37DRAFT_401254 [Exophiala viscosa]
MADDTRQSSDITPDDQSQSDLARSKRRAKHDFPQSQAGKMWAALGNPADPINEMPGGQYNSAGGKPADVSWKDAFNFSYHGKGPAWYQTPCSRDSLLVGIASGGGIGGLRFVLKGLSSVLVTTNYAVGAFALTAGGMYYWCDMRRKEEQRGIAQAVVGMKMLHEKKAREKKAAEEAAAALKAKEEEEQRKRNQHWYKFW